MKSNAKIAGVVFLLVFSIQILALGIDAKPQDILKLKNNQFSIQVAENGTIQQFLIKNKGIADTIGFRLDQFAGPSFDSIALHQVKKGIPVYSSDVNGITYKLEYKLISDAIMLIATVANNSIAEFGPEAVTLRLGIDNYQESFPQWRNILFPTLLRLEITHFWGYFMSPNGKILTIASPNPIPSWSLGYERKEKFPHYVGSHRINTSYLDLMRRELLRDRQPQNRKTLAPGKQVVDTIFMTPIKSLNELDKTISAQTKAPYLSFDKYTLYPGETTTAIIHSTTPITEVVVKQEGTSNSSTVDIKQLADQIYQLQWVAPSVESRFLVRVMNVSKKQSQATLYVRANWSAYLSQARKSGLRYLPTTTHHAEAFYPLYSYFLARKFVPDSIDDTLAEQVYNSIFPVLFDPKTREMRDGKGRIQDAANMAAILANRYAVTKDTIDLVNAHGLVEFLMRNQGIDGGYYGFYFKTEHYSCVNYVVKTIMEVLTQEYKLAKTSEIWRKRYNAGLRSVGLALADLVQRKDNLGTEGQMTFDDTTISCSIGQLAMGALRTSDPVLRQQYQIVAMELYNLHRCLTQQKIPDARMNGATLRFWESQFTINLMHNMMDSPCGWSAWKIYGTYYLYLLTGQKELLYETMNALGTNVQLMNLKNGDLYFAFVPDPYINDFQFKPSSEGSKIPTLQSVIVGEQYLPLISDWHTPPFYAWRPTKFGIDNFVHEVFKCVAEVAIQQAYLVENEDGTLEAFNCKVVIESGKIIIVPYEKQVNVVHVNLKRPHLIVVKSENDTFSYNVNTGLHWLGKVPEQVSTYELIKE